MVNSTKNFCACCLCSCLSSSDGVAISYVLPVFVMTLRSYIMGFMARRAYAYNSTTVYHLGLKSLQNTTLRVKRNHLRAAAMTGSDVIVFGIF